MALMLLTFLGLTLAATTSTELQIATNYRWSQQALYNAEAGIEAGKIILRNIPSAISWDTILPTVQRGALGTRPTPSPLRPPWRRSLPRARSSHDDWGDRSPQLRELAAATTRGGRHGLRRRPERRGLREPPGPDAEQDGRSWASA